MARPGRPEQPDHSASLGDSITSSTRIRFSVHTGRPMGMKPRTLALAAAALCGTTSIACSSPDSTAALSPTHIYQVTEPFTDDEGDVAMNISGLACMPTDATPSTRLVIDDQSRFAQIAIIGNGPVAAGARLPLISRHPSRDTVGQPPAETGCSDGERKFSIKGPAGKIERAPEREPEPL
jgi:hypothetical protein